MEVNFIISVVILLSNILNNAFPQSNHAFPVKDSVVIRNSTNKHLAFPDIVKLKSDSLLVVYREGETHVDKSGKIVAQTGSPDGLHWSEPYVFIDLPDIDDRDCSLELIGDDLCYNYFGYLKGDALTNPTIVHVHAGKSSVDGRSILSNEKLDKGMYTNTDYSINSDSIWVNAEGFPAMGYGCSSGAIYYNNKVTIAAYGGYPLVRRKNSKIFVSPQSKIALFSKKNGETVWAEHILNIPNTDTVWLQEPSLLNAGDSLLIMHVRTAFGKSIFNAGPMAQTISRDGGNSWSSLQYFPFTGHAPELYRVNNKFIVCGFRILNKEYTVESTAYIFSTNNGSTWSEPVIVENCGEKECGYPAFTTLHNGNVLMVYYCNDGTSIKAKVLGF